MSVEKICLMLQEKGDNYIDQCNILYGKLLKPFVDFGPQGFIDEKNDSTPKYLNKDCTKQHQQLELPPEMFEM